MKWIGSIFLGVSMVLAISCGGGGGGSETEVNSHDIEQTEVSSAVDTSILVDEKFKFKTTQEKTIKISVKGVNENTRACKVQIRMLDMYKEGEFGTWTGYLKKDGTVSPKLCIPHKNKRIKVLVHQEKMTSEFMLNQFTYRERLFKASYERDFILSEIENLSIVLVHKNNSKPTIVRQKVPGEREYVDKTISVPTEVVDIVNTLLPESVMPASAYLDSRYNPNLPVIANAQIEVTFIHEGAGYRNSFGYFTYTTLANGNINIVDRQLIFPNTSYSYSGGELYTGDTALLRDHDGNVRTFTPGENVGFFVIANGYNGSTVIGWDDANPQYPSEDPAENLSPARGTMTTVDSINPEVAAGRSDISRHVAMIKVNGIAGFLDGEDFFIVGMEDIRRNANSDNDFNDCVFIVRSNPITAIAAQDIVSYDSQNPDSDLDGVSDIEDPWPNDASKAYSTRTPSSGFATLIYEDLYPGVGDADYNDLVVKYAYEKVKNGFGEVQSIVGTFHFTARGSVLDHSFGIAFRDLPATTNGQVKLQRYSAKNSSLGTVITSALSSYGSVNADGSSYICIKNIVASTVNLLPGINSPYANTSRPQAEQEPASAKIIVEFSTPVDESLIGNAPFDSFIEVDNGYTKIDIHLPGKEGFVGRPSHLPNETDSDSFMTDDGWPWVLHVPTDFRYPLESVPIGNTPGNISAYTDFREWVQSDGVNKTDWYVRPSDNLQKKIVIDEMPPVNSRQWNID